MDSECLANCVIKDLKNNYLPHIAAAVLFAMLSPVLFGLAELNSQLSAQPIEMYLSLTGTILLTPVFLPEQDECILDMIRVRKTSYMLICLVRIMILGLAAAAIFAVTVLIMRNNGCDADMRHIAAGTADALLLGAIGIFASAVSGSAIVGYMVSIMYFVLNLTLKTKLGVFFLFQMSAGISSHRIWLFTGAAALTAASLVWKKIVKNI
ncbi:MAG: hypothetical protein IKQ90_03155 [Ruminococcus sp.]|nr:hypothetical protein [Ruminococcus sp.]